MSEVSKLFINWPTAGTTSQRYSIEGTQMVGFYTPPTLNSTIFKFQTCPTVDGNNIPGFGSNYAYTNIKVASITSGSQDFGVAVSNSNYYAFTTDQINLFKGIKHMQILGNSSETQGTQVIFLTRQLNP